MSAVHYNQQVKEISDRVMALKKRYTENVDSKEQLRKESKELEIKLGRAQARSQPDVTARWPSDCVSDHDGPGRKTV